jgi:hypothetical protein
MNTDRPVLVLSCGSTKNPAPWPLPAWKRYDGPIWRTLRSRWTAESNVELWVLSAGFGLIPADWHIRNYDRTMSQKMHTGRCQHTWSDWWSFHNPDMRVVWRELLCRKPYVVAGSSYRTVLSNWCWQSFDRASGAIGEQRQQLGRWLEQHA